MALKTVLENDVVVTTASSILGTDTAIAFNAPTGNYRAPREPVFGKEKAYVTLMDDLVEPTTKEVISYDNIFASELRGITRGLDGYTAQDWPAGTYIVGALSRAAVEALTGLVRIFKGAFLNPEVFGVFTDAGDVRDGPHLVLLSDINSNGFGSALIVPNPVGPGITTIHADSAFQIGTTTDPNIDGKINVWVPETDGLINIHNRGSQCKIQATIVGTAG